MDYRITINSFLPRTNAPNTDTKEIALNIWQKHKKNYNIEYKISILLAYKKAWKKITFCW